MWYRESSKHTSVMIAFYLDDDDAKNLAQDKGWFLKEKSHSEFEFEPEKPEDLHLTLAILNEEAKWQYKDKKDTINHILEAMSERWAPLDGNVVGLGYFEMPDKDVIYASYDCPTLIEFRAELIQALHGTGIFESREHGYTPHISLGYTTEPKTGQQMLPFIGEKSKVQLFGKDAEVRGKFKPRKLNLGKLVLRWGGEEAGEHPLKLITND